MPSGSFGLVRHPNPTLEHMRVARAGAVSEPASKTADRIGAFPRPHLISNKAPHYVIAFKRIKADVLRKLSFVALCGTGRHP